MLVGCDTGGTFTDFVMVQPGPPTKLTTLKLSSTPDDPSRAVLEGLSRLCPDAAATHLNHATTVATNALLERTGGRVVFFATAGFEDMLWLGRGQRDDLYALNPSRCRPPVSRQDGWSVVERLDAQGRVLAALTLPELEAGVVDGVDAAAVCLLHATVNPAHEEQLAEHLRALFPRVFISSSLSAASGEYERGMTCLLAAYLSPKVEGYLQRLVTELSGTQLSIVHSAGGLLTPQEATEQPHRLALSGPAAGLRGALSVSLECGQPNVVTLDMGGTSTDVALLYNKELPYKWSTRIENFPLLCPTLEIHTIGAGGGSLARVDTSGLLRVGPQSAGAQPGPACYGRGGSEATVTDALCWNGYLPDTLGDEQFPIDRAACRQALERLAGSLKLDRDQVADGILEVAAHHLAQAVRKVTTARGHDPSVFTLFAFGGAGPMVCCQAAELLDIKRVLIPARAGVLSAWGALTAPWEREWSRPVPVSERENSRSVSELLGALRVEVSSRALGPEVTLTSLVARRYRGQGETLVSSPEQDFHALHLEHFGFSLPHTAVQTLEVRVRAQAPPLPQASETAALHVDLLGEREIRFRGQAVSTAVYGPRHSFPEPQSGPFLWYQEGATIFVPPDWNARTLGSGHLLMNWSDS